MTEITEQRTIRDRFTVPDRRVDGDAKVSGQAKYTADHRLPDMLWAAFANSPFPHARIVSIDTTEAARVPGVRAIITGLDLGPLRFGRRLFDRPVLAYDLVRFVGDRVAAVAAETREAAEEAARLIDVTYEELPGVFTPAEALAPDAPVLHPDADAYLFQDAKRPPRAHPNLQGGKTLAKGDADLEPHFARAYRVYEHRFSTPRQHCGYLEPHATLVWIDAAGVVHVQTPCKAPFRLRDQLALVTGVPKEQIVIERSAIGGDFGGKGIVIDEFPCYFLAKATGRPVKYVSSYVDEMRAMSVRHAAEIVLRTGVDRDGTFLVHEAHVDYDGGAYAAGKPGPALTPGQLGFATIGYRVPHARLEVRSVYTNTVPASHMRAPADVQTVFAWEQHVDLIAADLGIDRFDLRLRNVMRDGDTALTDEAMHHPRGADVLETLRRESRWDEPRAHRFGRGRGIGFTCRHTGGGKTRLQLRLHADGTVHAITGVPDQGSGSATVIVRVVAAAMSIDPVRVRVTHENTANALNDPGAGASRVTHIVGGAAHNGAVALAERLHEILGATLEDDHFVDAAGRRMSFEEGAERACADGPLEVTGFFDGSHEDPSHPADYSFSAFVVDVDVDTETGAFRLTDVVFVVDVGTIINPVSHQGQIEGGYVYGWGGAVLEEMPIDEGGRSAALNLADYKLPSIADLPPLRTVLLPPIVAGGPFGAKMAGELSNAAIAPAIANAIADAVGVRVTQMPITAERVFTGLASRAPKTA